VLQESVAQFSLDPLVESGLVVPGEGDGFDLAPGLEAGASFVVLRDADSGEPFELLTRVGCLAADALPVFEILRDRQTQTLLREGAGNLLVTFDLPSVLTLRACGQPATLGQGLQNLPLEDVERFNEQFGWTDIRKKRVAMFSQLQSGERSQGFGPPLPAGGFPGQSPEDDSLDVGLVFLEWTVSELSRAVPFLLTPVVAELVQLERLMELDLEFVDLWQPETETLDRLRLIANRRHAPLFQRTLREEVEDAVYAEIHEFGKGRSRPACSQRGVQ